MKKLLVLFFILTLLVMTAAAQDTSSMLSRQEQKSGADTLYEQAPPQAKKSLDDIGLQKPSASAIQKFSLQNVFGLLWKQVREAAAAPFRSAASVIGILLASALLGTLKSTFGEKSLKTVFNTVCSLCIAVAVLVPVSGCISACADTISQSAKFSLAFLPVFTGLAAASGHPASALIFRGFLLTASQTLIGIAQTTFVPMVSIYLAFCVVGSVSPGVNLSGISGFVRKTVVWGLGLCVTIFVGILAIQGVIANAADSVSVKTAKFMVGSFVPVVGGAVAEAVNTVIGCANLIKTATGVYAIIVYILAFASPVFECILWMLAIDVASAVAGILSEEKMAGLLASIKEAVAIMLALVFTSAIALIISVSVMLLLGMGD